MDTPKKGFALEVALASKVIGREKMPELTEERIREIIQEEIFKYMDEHVQRLIPLIELSLSSPPQGSDVIPG